MTSTKDIDEPNQSPEIITSDTTPIGNVLDYWCMKDSKPRKSQIEAFAEMDNIPSHVKYIFLQVPVGGGKSPIALTYADYLGGKYGGTSYILTPQRILQRQYEESFFDIYGEKIMSMYGKANYECHTKLGLNCDVGSDIKPKCEDCTASTQFRKMATTNHVVLNYKLALLYSEMANGGVMDFNHRGLMVFDECHTLESQLVDHRAVQIGQKRCSDMDIDFYCAETLEEAYEWVVDIYKPALINRVEYLKGEVEYINDKYEHGNSTPLPSEFKTIKNYKDSNRHLELISNMTDTGLEELSKNYVFIKDENFFKFKEIYGQHLFNKLLEPMAEKFLFMSSTILNFDAYIDDIGLDRDLVHIIDLPSEFDVDNRPVYYMPTAKMNYGWNKKENKPKQDAMISQVEKLCNLHSDECGIIHTGSFMLSKWLVENLEGKIPQQIITHDQEDNESRDDCINTFTNNDGKKPMVFISPSITEGLDLKDDKSRFAIFAKIPYPHMGDAWVKRRMDLSNEWYQRQAMISIIQGGGRVVRSEQDWGNVYILDESFAFLWRQFKSRTPKWWKDAFKRLS